MEQDIDVELANQCQALFKIPYGQIIFTQFIVKHSQTIERQSAPHLIVNFIANLQASLQVVVGFLITLLLSKDHTDGVERKTYVHTIFVRIAQAQALVAILQALFIASEKEADKTAQAQNVSRRVFIFFAGDFFNLRNFAVGAARVEQFAL